MLELQVGPPSLNAISQFLFGGLRPVEGCLA